MKIVAVYNLKGGVGKTAAAVNLAYIAAREGYKTLLIDLDPQGSSSFYFRIRPSKKFNAEKFAKGKKIHKHIKETDFENLDLLPADFSFRSLDIIFDDEKKPERRLRKVISNFEEDYDLIFIDSPASIGVDSENIFYAADKILVPVIPTTLSMQSLEKVMDFYYQNKLDLSAIIAFFSMVDRRKKMHKDILEQYNSHGTRFLNKDIPYSSEVENMGAYRAPVTQKHPGSRSAKAFQSIWNEAKGRIFVKQDTVFFTERDTSHMITAPAAVEPAVKSEPSISVNQEQNEGFNNINIH